MLFRSVTFLEHFIMWQDPLPTLQFGAAMALVIVSLVLFQMYSHRATEDQKANNPDVQARAKRRLFQEDREQQEIELDEVAGTNKQHDE